uniref:Mitochondrial assembly of ribosomal large subunit protein 1 n=1 Tax=Daphnia sinensis TaxID=1820382 RepID=A0A4Y7ND74_9CRUS|nr:EOG090X0AI9 [Daphnia sinensis]
MVMQMVEYKRVYASVFALLGASDICHSSLAKFRSQKSLQKISVIRSFTDENLDNNIKVEKKTKKNENSNELPHANATDNKSEETNLFEEENWQRIGDSETVEEFDEFQGISLQRGTTGIFDIEEFVEILNNQKLQDIVVIAVPSQLNYVDYMVITTGKSPKQMTAVAEFIRKLSKRRCLTTDPLPVIEGKNNKDWIALDLGNIALHIFSSKVRKIYDLETLWTCGPDFDDLSIEKDTLTSPMNCYTFPSQKSV